MDEATGRSDRRTGHDDAGDRQDAMAGAPTAPAINAEERIDGQRPAKAKHRARTVEAQRIRWGRKPGRWIRWTVSMRETFLDHLAATCNIRGAAAAIGVDPAGAYYLRRADPAFTEAWSEALRLGYEVLETQLVGHALTGGGREIANGATELTGAIDVDLALRLLAAHRADRAPRRHGAQRKVAPADETDAAILRKLDQLAKRARRETGA